MTETLFQRNQAILVKTSQGWWPGRVWSTERAPDYIVELAIIPGRRMPKETHYGTFRHPYYRKRLIDVNVLDIKDASGKIIF